MGKYHRFHLKVDAELLSAINYAAAYSCTTTKGYINYILKRMNVYLDDIDIRGEGSFIKDDTKGFSRDLIVLIEDVTFEKLRYMHFRFKSFSIADILRKILRLCVLSKKGEMVEVLSELNTKYKAVKSVFVEIKAHMCLKKENITRIITINEKNNISNITIFT